MVSGSSNGLQQANDLVRSIHHQITCADAPINNLSEVQELLGKNGGDKLQPTLETNDNVSSTASEYSYNSSIGPSYVSKRPPMPPSRPPRENHSVHNLEDAAAILTGTVSLANLCKRTDESLNDLESGDVSFPTLPPFDSEIRPVDPTPRRSNSGSSLAGPLPQSDEQLAHLNENDRHLEQNVGDFAHFKDHQFHKKSTPNKASDTSQQKPRMQMFASEYARILSSTKQNYSALASHNRSKLPPTMGVSSKLKAKLSRSDHDAGVGATLEDCPSSVATAAITDLIVTAGSDIPPRGYYRAFSLEVPEKNIGPTRKRPKRLYVNAKKELNWDRAVQRPCVTAICVIHPDKNEFVPPGFSVVRLYGGHHATTVTDSNESAFGSSSTPANINPSSSGERVYLCYRRSREGNPITGIKCLKPTRGDIIPVGYTVLERTPRNFVADMYAKSCDHPTFLAYRQRLENLESLRPLPLVLAVLQSRSDVAGRKELKAYYCTGGSTVASDVGHLVRVSMNEVPDSCQLLNYSAIIFCSAYHGSVHA